jgi:hypothetical protein
MTAPSYTEDLTDLTNGTGDEASGWAESTNVNWQAGASIAYQDNEYPYIQGSYAVTEQTKKTGVATLIANNGGGTGGHGTDGAYFLWMNFSSPFNVDTYANGGFRVLVGSGLGDFYAWDVGGKDKGRYPFGGWQCFAVNTSETPDDTVGSPTATEQYVGGAVNVATGISKGQVHQVDMIRYGRGSSIFEYGEAADYCTIAGFAAQNDTTSYMWGLIQDIGGVYLYKGKMTLGTGSNAVDFRDSGVLILIDDTPKCTANFNTIEVNNASSRVDMENFVFKALGTQSPGRWVTNANADLNIESCQFLEMGAFTLGGSGSEFLNCLFQSCGLITVAGGKLNGSKVLTSSVTSGGAIDWDLATDPDGYLDDMEVSKGSGTHHAINFGAAVPATMTIRGCTFTGFNAADNNDDSTFYFEDTGGTITLNCVNCSGNVTYKSAGATIVIVSDPVTVKVTAVDTDGVEVENARVFAKAKDGTGPFPFEETVTIANSGVTATVTHTGHGMASNDYVNIDLSGSADWKTHLLNDGVFQITVTGVDTYTYTMSGAPGSSPSGTIKATFVALYGLTDANGVKSTSRVYATDQPLTGWVRNTPTHKTAKLFGDVDSTDGYLTTAVLSAD